MTKIKTASDIYPAVEELIKQLRLYPKSNLSAILDHRMHKVAWTTRSELLEEIYNVLKQSRSDNVSLFDTDIKDQIDQLIDAIKTQINPKIVYTSPLPAFE